MTAEARAQLDRVRVLLERLELKWVDLEPVAFGAGLAVGWEDGFTVVSVLAGGSESQACFTSGVLRDIAQERLSVLDVCNTTTRDRPAYPVFLHDAQQGWDVLIQVVVPIDLLHDAPGYLYGCVRNLPTVAEQVRPNFEEVALGGVPYQWNASDLERLLIRSLL